MRLDLDKWSYSFGAPWPCDWVGSAIREQDQGTESRAITSIDCCLVVSDNFAQEKVVSVREECEQHRSLNDVYGERKVAIWPKLGKHQSNRLGQLDETRCTRMACIHSGTQDQASYIKKNRIALVS